MNTNASMLVILVMGKYENYLDCFYFLISSNLPSSAGIICELLVGGHPILTGHVLDSLDYWKVLQCTKLKLPAGPSFGL